MLYNAIMLVWKDEISVFPQFPIIVWLFLVFSFVALRKIILFFKRQVEN